MNEYCKELFLGFFEKYQINNVFVQKFRYKLPGQNQINKTLLDKAYMNIKDKVKIIL